ncbi:hypothetical protein CBA19CS42_30275 [Caballeronia novacaledonica]|uniref:Uncharacterized protein n=1 Tax=Caballeronia novacaledonica TaxID=1544861 RepID=A0AA37IHR9_9BURK|nr:hypothetical protein CBA19CS42_30275 [Caballeronia novacaledonica]
MTEFLGGDIEQQVFAARIIFPDGLREVPARGRQFALRTAELLKQQIGKTRIGHTHAHGVLQTLVVNEHLDDSSSGTRNPSRVWREISRLNGFARSDQEDLEKRRLRSCCYEPQCEDIALAYRGGKPRRGMKGPLSNRIRHIGLNANQQRMCHAFALFSVAGIVDA